LESVLKKEGFKVRRLRRLMRKVPRYRERPGKLLKMRKVGSGDSREKTQVGDYRQQSGGNIPQGGGKWKRKTPSSMCFLWYRFTYIGRNGERDTGSHDGGISLVDPIDEFLVEEL